MDATRAHAALVELLLALSVLVLIFALRSRATTARKTQESSRMPAAQNSTAICQPLDAKMLMVRLSLSVRVSCRPTVVTRVHADLTVSWRARNEPVYRTMNALASRAIVAHKRRACCSQSVAAVR